jgi:hypothetical protein
LVRILLNVDVSQGRRVGRVGVLEGIPAQGVVDGDLAGGVESLQCQEGCLLPVVNFINILPAAFASIFFCQKITKAKQ